jgi:hypothetical protein
LCQVPGKVCYFFNLHRIRENKRRKINFLDGSALFRLFLYKIGQTPAAALSSHSTFYSALFELYGRTIGQLTTLYGTSLHKCLIFFASTNV